MQFYGGPDFADWHLMFRRSDSITLPHELMPSRKQLCAGASWETRQIKDFFLLTEFTENKGPLNMLEVGLADQPSCPIDLERLAVRLMSADYFSQHDIFSSSFYFPKDVHSLITINEGALDMHVLVYAVTLFDIHCRAYKRPIYLSYITEDRVKLEQISRSLVERVQKALEPFLYSNMQLFKDDIQEELKCLESMEIGSALGSGPSCKKSLETMERQKHLRHVLTQVEQKLKIMEKLPRFMQSAGKTEKTRDLIVPDMLKRYQDLSEFDVVDDVIDDGRRFLHTMIGQADLSEVRLALGRLHEVYSRNLASILAGSRPVLERDNRFKLYIGGKLLAAIPIKPKQRDCSTSIDTASVLSTDDTLSISSGVDSGSSVPSSPISNYSPFASPRPSLPISTLPPSPELKRTIRGQRHESGGFLVENSIQRNLTPEWDHFQDDRKLDYSSTDTAENVTVTRKCGPDFENSDATVTAEDVGSHDLRLKTDSRPSKDFKSVFKRKISKLLPFVRSSSVGDLSTAEPAGVATFNKPVRVLDDAWNTEDRLSVVPFQPYLGDDGPENRGVVDRTDAEPTRLEVDDTESFHTPGEPDSLHSAADSESLHTQAESGSRTSTQFTEDTSSTHSFYSSKSSLSDVHHRSFNVVHMDLFAPTSSQTLAGIKELIELTRGQRRVDRPRKPKDNASSLIFCVLTRKPVILVTSSKKSDHGELVRKFITVLSNFVPARPITKDLHQECLTEAQLAYSGVLNWDKIRGRRFVHIQDPKQDFPKAVLDHVAVLDLHKKVYHGLKYQSNDQPSLLYLFERTKKHKQESLFIGHIQRLLHELANKVFLYLSLAQGRERDEVNIFKKLGINNQQDKILIRELGYAAILPPDSGCSRGNIDTDNWSIGTGIV